MKKIVRKFLPQWVINYFWHLPKAVLANVVYGLPARGVKVIGVTGTDGKTTTVNMIYQILKAAGKKVSMVSTLNAPGFHVTSPDPFVIQKFAKDLRNEYLVLEVTSHGLDQFRFWGIKFEVGVITNITHEHLDYHKTFENYRSTKLKLLKNSKKGVEYKKLKLKLKIPGEYNIENASAAVAVTTALGIDQELARKAVENFEGLTGRMEEVKNNRGIKIIIDFAHTPNALERVLKTLKSDRGRLIAVFGCAGKRDEGKRPLMGEIAGRLADSVVITAEDPRGELKSINEQIIAGVKNRKKLFVVSDRQAAIHFAINKLAKKGDTVGIFGKGHERSMNLDGKKEIPWSDKEAVEKVLHGQ
ncbi:hypothetical protein HYZ06_00100 [Candidatus Daviesbacteria bacterium]|nr:hypothetical protein [Candidatus Daviesbacteria bacterium]